MRRRAKVMQHFVLAGRIQLEYYTAAPCTPARGRAEEVACRVSDKSSVWVHSVSRRRTEVMQHGFIPGRIKLEHDSTAKHSRAGAGSAAVRSTVAFAFRVPDNARVRVASIGRAWEAIQPCFLARCIQTDPP
jgi:hypothetical protein